MTNETKMCRHCKEVKLITEFYIDRGRIYTRCKECSAIYKAGLRQVRKTATPKPACCELCGTNSTELFMDHDRIKLKFRGWLCRNCNTAIGLVGDDIKGVVSALNYLVERA